MLFDIILHTMHAVLIIHLYVFVCAENEALKYSQCIF